MAKYGIKLLKSAQTRFVVNNVDGFRMRIEATAGNNMPNEIFRYIRGPIGSNGTYRDEFDGVCSPSDIEEFDVDSPSVSANPAWFRKSYIDLVFRSQTTAKEAWDRIVSDVEILVRSLKYMDDMTLSEQIDIGDPIDSGSSSSSSGSSMS